MNIELPTQYEPASVEARIYQQWISAGTFRGIPDGREARFSVVIPPPNVTGALHLGHAINGTIQDILVRYHRMRGDNTLWMPGIDHAGIATQAVVEKTIFEKEKKSRHDLGREELVSRIWQWKEAFGTRILNQLQSIGASCDWDRTRFTLDDVCAKAVRHAFFRMFKDGLIFRGKRLVNWDAHLQTAVADDEIYYEKLRGQLTSIRYPVADSDESLVVATTRPETMLGDTAVAVHPDDPRYKHLIGKQVIIPLVGRKIPVIADGLLVDPAFGTGVVKVTPAHDPNDYATGIRHNLEQINLLTPDGRVNDLGKGSFNGQSFDYSGLKFSTEARRKVMADLEALGLIVETKVHEHEVGHSDRSKTPIEPYLSDQWFVRMGDVAGQIKLANGHMAPGLAQAAIDAVEDGRVRIVPERYAKGYVDWLSQKRDWCISRQLWWGHRIPVWSKRVTLTQENWTTELLRWGLDSLASDGQKVAVTIYHAETGATVRPRDLMPVVAETEGTYDIHVCLLEETQAGRLEAGGLVRDPDVLDTWFSSALWPISTMGWPENGTSSAGPDQLLPYYYPTSVLSTAREILTLWVARMVMFGLYAHGDIPFRQVYIHAVIQDGEGKPMKKSLGNGVDPVDIVQSHGADALRFTLASMATETQDIRMPVVKDKQGKNTSPKFDLGRNFANKVWNASRFILSQVDAATGELPPVEQITDLADRWILSRLQATLVQMESALREFRFSELAGALHQFFWTDLCDWYLEISKARLRSGDATIQAVLLHVLRNSLKLLHPVMPFVSEAIWEKLPPTSETMLITAAFPQIDSRWNDSKAESQIALVQAITRAIRDLRNQYQIPPSQKLSVHLRPQNQQVVELLESSRGIIEPLAQATLEAIGLEVSKPADAATAVLPESEVYVAGVINKDAESKKLLKRKEELTKFIAGNQAKLSNESFTAKAPAQIVQGLREQLAKMEAEMAAVEKNLQDLG